MPLGSPAPKASGSVPCQFVEAGGERPGGSPVSPSSPAYRRCLVVVAIVYAAVFGALLIGTDGLPYVMDNNESFSSLRHAENLVRFGFRNSYGLTDESYAVQKEGHPFLHTHQGNWPRLFAFLIYLLGATTIESQIAVTALTVGVIAVFFAYHYFARIVSPVFGAILCGLLMTDYLLFTQWHLVTYRVWHCLFLFSTLLCAHGLGGRRRSLWGALTVLNYACLFYYELVFATFVALFGGIYAAVLYRRSVRLVVRAWVLQGLGAAVSLAVLAGQLLAYLGWDGFVQDVRLTILARNEAGAAGPALLRQMSEFFEQHNIVFWYNFADGADLRLVRKLLLSLTQFDLQIHTPYLTILTLVLFTPWLLQNAGAEVRGLLAWLDRRSGSPALLRSIWTRAVRLAGASLELAVGAGGPPPPTEQSARFSLGWLECVLFKGRISEIPSRGIRLSIAFLHVRSVVWASRSSIGHEPADADLGVELAAAIGTPPESVSRRGLRFSLFGFSLSARTGLPEAESRETQRMGAASLEAAVFVLLLVLIAFDPAAGAMHSLTLGLPLWKPALLALAGAALFLRLLNWTSSGRWGRGLDLAPSRLVASALAVIAAALLLRGASGWFDMAFRPLWGDQLKGWLSQGVNRAALLAAVFWVCVLIARGPADFFGGEDGRRMRGLFAYLACGLAAYTIVYYLSPGYVMTGYLHRGLSFTVYLTVLTIAVPIYQLLLCAGTGFSSLPPRRLFTPEGAKAGLAVGLLVVVAGLWLGIQARWATLLPPDHYAFLKKLRGAPYKGATFLVGTYAAPVAALTGNWAYYDPGFPTGDVALREDGFEVRRDLRHVWFADRKTNPAYLKPDYYLCMVPQTPATTQAALPEQGGGRRQFQSCLYQGLIQQDLHDAPRPLRHRLVDWDKEGQRRSNLASWAVVKLDWEYPPFLAPAPGADSAYPVAMAVVEKRHSPGSPSYEVTFQHRYAHQDNTPERPPVVELLSYGRGAGCSSSDDEIAVLSREEGPAAFTLPGGFAGKVGIRLTPRSIHKVGMAYYSRIVRIDPASRFRIQQCEIPFPEQFPRNLKATRPEPQAIRLLWDRLPGARWYRIEMASPGAPFGYIGPTEQPLPSYLVLDIAASGSYRFRIRGCANHDQCSGSSEVESPPF